MSVLNPYGRKSAKNGTRRNRVGENFLLVVSASLVAQLVKNLPAMQEKGMATRSILAWRIPWFI